MSDKIKEHKGELPIDWCPICGEKLGDNTVKTRLAHHKLKHPPYTLSKFIKDVKTKNSKAQKAVWVTSLIVILTIVGSQQLANLYDANSIDCPAIANSLSNYSNEHGIDEHVLKVLNSTKSCHFALSMNYSLLKIPDTNVVQECKTCNYTVTEYYPVTSSIWNFTKLNEQFGKVLGK